MLTVVDEFILCVVERIGGRPAAKKRASFQHRDMESGFGQYDGSGKSGEAAANNENVSRQAGLPFPERLKQNLQLLGF